MAMPHRAYEANIISFTNKETKSRRPSWLIIVQQKANNGTGFKAVHPLFLYITPYSPVDHFSAGKKAANDLASNSDN